MDQAILVENRIDEGREYVKHLQAKGFDVVAGFWLKEFESERWYLFIASALVDQQGPLKAYRLLYEATSDLSTPSIEMFQVKLIGLNDPLTQDVLAIQQRYSGKLPMRYGGPRLGGWDVEDAYIYSPQ